MHQSFGHLSVLVVVLNAIGLATLIIGMATFLRRPVAGKVVMSGVLVAWCLLHLYLHVMLWWRFYGMQVDTSFNFFGYIFLLIGPLCLFFGSALLLPEEQNNTIDMPVYLDRISKRLFAFEAGFWLWALLFGPLILGTWMPLWYLWAIMLAIVIIMMFAKSTRLRVGLTAGAWLVQVVFISTEAFMLRQAVAG